MNDLIKKTIKRVIFVFTRFATISCTVLLFSSCVSNDHPTIFSRDSFFGSLEEIDSGDSMTVTCESCPFPILISKQGDGMAFEIGILIKHERYQERNEASKIAGYTQGMGIEQWATDEDISSMMEYLLGKGYLPKIDNDFWCDDRGELSSRFDYLYFVVDNRKNDIYDIVIGLFRLCGQCQKIKVNTHANQ